ncbi:MAG: TldD/PmbA family protein [Candidatus Atelocyanobacterium thalassa]
MLHIEQVAYYAQESSKELNITKYDIYGSAIEETSIEVDRGNPKQLQVSNRSSVIVRVWNKNGKIGVTTTTDLDKIGIKLALQTAKDASYFGVQEHVPDFSPEASAVIESISTKISTSTPIPVLVDTLIAAEKTLLESSPIITSIPYNGLSQENITRFYLNSNSALRQEDLSYTAIYFYSRTEAEGKKPRGASSIKISRDFATLDIECCLQELIEKTLSHLNYQSVPSGKYTVIFSPTAFLSLINSFTNLFNAQNILDKQSLSTTSSLGKQISATLFSLYDDARHINNVGMETFDQEGTPTRRVEIINNGILTGLLHSESTAQRLNSKPTGHANIGSKVTIRPHFYHILSNEKSNSKYDLNTVKDVVFVDKLQALHAGVNSLQGSFSLPFEGWLVNNGNFVSIDAATIAGDFLTLLNSIIHIESEPEITPKGICPRIWVDNLSITGN